MNYDDRPNELNESGKLFENKEKAAPQDQQIVGLGLHELLAMPVIATMHSRSKLARELKLDDRTFPQVDCPSDLVADPTYLEYKRRTWEASIRSVLKTNEAVRFELRVNVRASRADAAGNKLASRILNDFDKYPHEFFAWMN